MNDYNKYEFRKDIQELCQSTQKSLTDSYIWVEIAYEALCKINPQNLVFKSGDKAKIRKDYSESLKSAKKVELYYSSYVYLYSKLEVFFIKLFEVINKHVPNMLEQREIKHFIEKDFDAQLYILNDKLGLNVSEIRMKKFNFMRNLRNIIIHNNGYVDDRFSKNTNYEFDYKTGERIYLEQNFEFIVKEMKGIIGALNHCVKERYNLPNSEEYNRHKGINFNKKKED